MTLSTRAKLTLFSTTLLTSALCTGFAAAAQQAGPAVTADMVQTGTDIPQKNGSSRKTATISPARK